MKKLLIITADHFPYGSASANLLRLMGVGLLKHGWSVGVLIQRGLLCNTKQPATSRAGVEQGIPFWFCGFRLRPQNLLLKQIDTWMGNLVALYRICIKKMRKEVDVVLLYNNSGLEGAFICAICKLLNIRVVAYVSEWYEKASVIKRWYHVLKWWDFLFRMKWVNPCFDGLVLPSYFLFNYYKDEKRIPASRLYILPNLVDLSFFRGIKADAEFPKTGLRIGYCGTPTRKDGAEDLLRAFQIVHERDSSAELMIIGDSVGDTHLLPHLKHIAADLGVIEKVVFTGLVPFSRMPELLHSCDILALARPSGVFAEAGFPTKLGEYMACNKPVVLTRVGDMPRYLSHKKNAMLAEPDHPANFAKQILWLIDHPTEALEIANQGCLWATETLSHENATLSFSTFLQRDQ